MCDDKHTGRLPRREFIKLSGGVGAAAVLGPAVPAAVKRLPPPGSANLCGNPGDTSYVMHPTPQTKRYYLWDAVQHCEKGLTQANPKCLATVPDYVVLQGSQAGTGGTRNFLLLPSERVMGIECPKLWGAPGYSPSLAGKDYWKDAWDEATKTGGPGHVDVGTGYQLALGVNSRDGRQQDQLHIHMATVNDTYVPAHLDSQWQHIAQQPANWPGAILPVNGHKPGTTTPQTNNYRVLHVQNLNGDLFKLLHDNVVNKLGEQMVDQSLIVTGSPKHKGYYILNTAETNNLKTGSGSKAVFGTVTCDSLLIYT